MTGGDHNLLNQGLATDSTLLALGQAIGGTGLVIAGQNLNGVAQGLALGSATDGTLSGSLAVGICPVVNGHDDQIGGFHSAGGIQEVLTAGLTVPVLGNAFHGAGCGNFSNLGQSMRGDLNVGIGLCEFGESSCSIFRGTGNTSPAGVLGHIDVGNTVISTAAVTVQFYSTAVDMHCAGFLTQCVVITLGGNITAIDSNTVQCSKCANNMVADINITIIDGDSALGSANSSNSTRGGVIHSIQVEVTAVDGNITISGINQVTAAAAPQGTASCGRNKFVVTAVDGDVTLSVQRIAGSTIVGRHFQFQIQVIQGQAAVGANTGLGTGNQLGIANAGNNKILIVCGRRHQNTAGSDIAVFLDDDVQIVQVVILKGLALNDILISSSDIGSILTIFFVIVVQDSALQSQGGNTACGEGVLNIPFLGLGGGPAANDLPGCTHKGHGLGSAGLVGNGVGALIGLIDQVGATTVRRGLDVGVGINTEHLGEDIAARNDFLGNQNLATDRTLLAFGQSVLGLGSFHSGDNFLGVGQLLDNLAGLQDLAANRALLAISHTDHRAGSFSAGDDLNSVLSNRDLFLGNQDITTDGALHAISQTSLSAAILGTGDDFLGVAVGSNSFLGNQDHTAIGALGTGSPADGITGVLYSSQLHNSVGMADKLDILCSILELVVVVGVFCVHTGVADNTVSQNRNLEHSTVLILGSSDLQNTGVDCDFSAVTNIDTVGGGNQCGGTAVELNAQQAVDTNIRSCGHIDFTVVDDDLTGRSVQRTVGSCFAIQAVSSHLTAVDNDVTGAVSSNTGNSATQRHSLNFAAIDDQVSLVGLDDCTAVGTVVVTTLGQIQVGIQGQLSAGSFNGGDTAVLVVHSQLGIAFALDGRVAVVVDTKVALDQAVLAGEHDVHSVDILRTVNSVGLY